MNYLLLFIIISLVQGNRRKANAEKQEDEVHYDGNTVIRTFPKTPEQVKALKDIAKNYDFWTQPRPNGSSDVRVTAKNKGAFMKVLTKNKIENKVLIRDVETLVKKERADKIKTRSSKLDWSDYYSYAELEKHWTTLASKNKLLVTKLSAGKSTEKRDLTILKIGKLSKRQTIKKSFWLDGGIHAREWIASAIVSWMVNELVTNQTKYKDLLEKLDFYIMPLVNPDGYEFSRQYDRMWRKTRSVNEEVNNPSSCFGVDPNRNFAYKFGGQGTSSNPCEENYKGQKAFSEPETRFMTMFIKKKKKDVDWWIYVTVHAYSQMILIPWGYTPDLPKDFGDLYTLGMKAKTAIAGVHGTRYEVGQTTLLMGPAAGGSDDWAKGSGTFKYSYTIETRDEGEYGFLLPKEQIIPAAEEVWAGILAMARFIADQP